MDERLCILSDLSFRLDGRIWQTDEKDLRAEKGKSDPDLSGESDRILCGRGLAWRRMALYCLRNLQWTDHRVQRSNGGYIPDVEKEAAYQ